jgi:diacylglycerol kinase (ATP)
MRRRVLIIVNPAAGRSRSRARYLRRVAAALERLGCAAVVRHASDRIGDVERLARDAEPDFDAIVAAGGDGTVNAVANGVAGAAPSTCWPARSACRARPSGSPS